MTSELTKDGNTVQEITQQNQQLQQNQSHPEHSQQIQEKPNQQSTLISNPPKFLPFNEPIDQDRAPAIPHPMQQPVQQLSPRQLSQTIQQPSLLEQAKLPADVTNPNQQATDTLINPSSIQTISQHLEEPNKQAKDVGQQQTLVQIQQQNQMPVSQTTTASSSSITIPNTPTKAVITQTVNLTQEMNLFEWFRTTDIMNQIAEKAKHSVDSVITTLDPGMKEYLFSGGNINVVVVTDHDSHISPIRDAFLSVFGRATIGTCFTKIDYPIRVAIGYKGALEAAKCKIDKLRQDASTFPQNQVVLVVQPTLINSSAAIDSNDTINENSGNNNESPNWFYTYASVLDDPVLGLTLHTFSQLIPIDLETIVTLKDDNYTSMEHLGFCKSLDETMNAELKILPLDQEDTTSWIKLWSGLEDKKIIHDSAISLAHSYQRKWNNNVVR